MNLTEQGAIAATPEEIRADLITQAEAQLSNFTNIPAELRTDLLEESVILISQMEAIGTDTFNSIAPRYANDVMVKQFGESFGLKMKDTIYSSVVVTFYGTAGTIVPEGTQVQSLDGMMTFYTTKNVAVLPSGNISVLVESTESYTTPIFPLTITVLVNTIPNITRITNLNIGTNGLPPETIDQYRLRTQERMRSNRMGSISYALSQLSLVYGVEDRLTNFRNQIKRIDGVLTNSVECVVGGGDDYEVAFTLFGSFLSPILFSSEPSDGDINRTITSTLTLNGMEFEIKFTRPKLKTVDMNISVKVVTGSVPVPDSAIKDELYKIFYLYFENLRTGSSLAKYLFINMIFQTFTSMGIDIKNVEDIEFGISINGVLTVFDLNNRIPTDFDVAYTFGDVNFTKVG